MIDHPARSPRRAFRSARSAPPTRSARDDENRVVVDDHHQARRTERGDQLGVVRLLGEVARHRNPPEVEPAADHYRQALALAEELGMRPLQAHCHRSLGMLYRQTGRDDLARAALSTAIEMYRTMDMTFWLPQAESALAQVERQ